MASGKDLEMMEGQRLAVYLATLPRRPIERDASETGDSCAMTAARDHVSEVSLDTFSRTPGNAMHIPLYLPTMASSHRDAFDAFIALITLKDQPRLHQRSKTVCPL